MPAGWVMIGAVAADAVLGEFGRWHPLVAFGRAATFMDERWNRTTLAVATRCLLGGAALLLLVLPPVMLGAWLAMLPHGWVAELVLVYFALGLRSLGDHARAVQRVLEAGSLADARRAVGMMVSRDTGAMNERQVSAATVESVLENGNDAVFGTLFWFVVAGAPGVVMHRLVNTLDAMWGYRTERLEAFGWAAARLDDVLNWIPARLTALTYALVSAAPVRALVCARRQGGRTESPNAGRVMAAGAGALGVRLGGPGIYHGHLRRRPRFGAGALPRPDDIGRALRLVRNGTILWILAVFLVEWALA